MKQLIGSLLVTAALAGCSGSEAPDLIVHNANLLTMQTLTHQAQAFAVRDGEFIFVGSNSAALEMAGEQTQVVDAEMRTIVPGFNDAHLHALGVPPGSVDLSDTRSISDLVNILRNRSANVSEGQWIIGYGYDDTLLGRHPTREDLDTISTTQPVLLVHASLHLFAVNSHALDEANITSETPDPNGGRFYRDNMGTPTGRLSEAAALELLFVDTQPSPLPDSFTTALNGLHTFFDVALSHGITSFGDAAVPEELAFIYWWADPEAHGVRVNLMLNDAELAGVGRIAQMKEVLGWVGYRPFSTPWLRVNTVKVFHGLSLSGRTARLHEPYANRPDYYGDDPQRTQDELNRLVADIDALGFQAAIHSNGDFEIDMVLDAIEETAEANPRDHRHRIEHGSIVSERILQRIKALKIVLAPHSYIYEKGPIMEAYGEHRWPMMFTNASTFELGIPNAANSDYPVSALSPMIRIQSLVTRTSRFGKVYGPEQRITVNQALYAYTMGSAHATFEEDVKGSIAVGKYADFVILSADPNDVPHDEIKDISVEATYVAGIQRYGQAD